MRLRPPGHHPHHRPKALRLPALSLRRPASNARFPAWQPPDARSFRPRTNWPPDGGLAAPGPGPPSEPPASPVSLTNGSTTASNGKAPPRPGLGPFRNGPRTGPLFGRVIGGSPKGDNGIERVFTAARPALAAIDASMMDDQDGNSLPPQPQQPILHWQPRIACTFAAGRHKRRQVVEDKQVNAIEMTFKSLLAFHAAEIDAALGVVGSKDAKSVIRNLGAKSEQYRSQSPLKIGKRHFAIDIQNTSRSRSGPTQERSGRSQRPSQSRDPASFCRAHGASRASTDSVRAESDRAASLAAEFREQGNPSIQRAGTFGKESDRASRDE